MVLDYISAKVAVSSNDARRSVPFRRRNEDKHTCSELIQQNCSDPQTAFYMMLAGNWDILQHSITSGISPDNSAPYSYGTEFLWAGTTNYKINPLILDLLVDRSHRNFYQFFHTSRKLEEDDFDDSVDELYAASPSYLLSAGSHGTHAAYTATVPWPFSLIPAFGINDELTGPFGVSHPSHDSDKGFAPPTTLMPTGAVHSRDDMIRFDASLCVAPNFACGSNPQIPGSYAPEVIGPWSFINRSAIAPNYGYYAAVFQGAGWGFLEACDTFIDPCKSKTYDDFKAAVQANNPDPTAFSNTGTNTYKTFDGKTIQFSIGDGMIVNINGQAPYDPNRTNGTIIDNNGAGTITITNPFRKDLGTNGTLTLDATVPPAHPQITIPGPLTFPDTCVGSKSLATLNICNDGNGTDNLTVYNILALTNNQFQVTEPTSGYPTTIGSNFCFPFQAQFAPVLTGAIADKLTISNSDPNVPELKLPVSGKGIQQAIGTVIANGGDFGNVCLGSYVDLNLTINNKGGCDLTITGITSDSADFGTAATVAFPLTIHAGTSLAVPIRFHPSKFGAAAAKITVANNDPATPNAVVPITGNAPAPVINASVVNNGNFGNVCAGAQADLALQVLNAGLCPLTISSVSSMQTAPAGGPSFLLPSVTAFPLVLSAGGSVNLPVRFQPPAYGSGNYITCSNAVAQAANVVIHSNDPHYPDPVGFVRSVGGIEGCPTLVLSPHDLTGAYAFPATVSDPNGTLGCYTDQQITVSNSGICPLTLASLATANGTDGKNLPLPGAPLEFKVVNPTTPVTIAPGASPVPITVRFKPIILANQSSSAPDQQTGMLSIVSNDPVAADNQAGLCGEPTYQSGARVLVVDTSTSPVSSLANLTLSSQGLTPTFKQTLMPAALRSAPNICGNTILYHLDNETLRPAGTTGNNPKASYQVSAKNGSTQANMSFTLGQCETKRIVLQIK
jgi:hypothetical protein